MTTPDNYPDDNPDKIFRVLSSWLSFVLSLGFNLGCHLCYHLSCHLSCQLGWHLSCHLGCNLFCYLVLSFETTRSRFYFIENLFPPLTKRKITVSTRRVDTKFRYRIFRRNFVNFRKISRNIYKIS
jgi:hypothetical protein